MGKPKDLGHLAHIVTYDASNNITLPGSITMHTNQLVASQSWVNTALGSYALSSALGSYVPTSRTITINGTTFDLSANRSWDITSMIYPSAGIPLSTGSAWGTSITNNSANWNTAYGWGNHASAGYLTGITSTQVTTALGYTPVTNARTITINGTTYDLSADRSWTVSGTDSTKLPLSGGTLTGQLIIGTTGVANTPTLRINTSSNVSFVHTQENFAANLTSGNRAMIFFGKEGSTKNAGGIGYYWAGAASNSNFITLGHWGNDDLFRVYGDGLVMATTNFVVGTQQGFDNPGGWNKNVLIDGTNHGRFRIKASNYTYGNIDVALWADSSVTPSHGIHGSHAVFSFGSSINTLTVAGNTVLHASNYSSYALPLSGGTVTGIVNFGPDSSNDNGIGIRYGNYASGYGRIRFYQDGSNHQTIHSFSASWQGGAFSSSSAGAININGQNGVTLGPWNSPAMWVDNSGNGWFRGNVTASSNLYIANSNFAFGIDKWAGAGGYPGFSFTGGNNRFGFSSTGGAIDVYTDGNFYCGIDYNGSNNLVLHAGNYSSYALPLNGNWGGSTGMNDQKLYLRTNGDDNHFLWNADDDWEELRYYTGTGFRVQSSNGTVPAYFNNAGIYASAYRGKDNVGGTGTASWHPDGMYSGGTEWLYGNMYRNGSATYHGWGNLHDVGTIYTNNWFRSYGDSGLYNQDYACHFRRNAQSSYGTWEIFGYNKNGYGGLNIYDPQGYSNNLMYENGNGGMYQENGAGWAWYYNRGSDCFAASSSTTNPSYRFIVDGTAQIQGDFNPAAYTGFGGNTEWGNGTTQYHGSNTAYNWRDWGGWGGYWWSRNGGDMIMNLYALYSVTGSISDIRYKKDVEALPYGLNEIMQLNPIKYHYNLPKESMIANDPDYFLGFSAQEVQALIPEAVHEKVGEDVDSMKGMLAITYDELIPVTVQAIKEQQVMIHNQNIRIQKLEALVTQLLNN